MLIKEVSLFHTKMELNTPFETSLGIEKFEEHIIVKIWSEGVTGWGECVVEPAPSYSSETVKTAWHVLSDFLIPTVLNRKISTAEEYRDKISWVRGHRMAKVGIEAALWDLFAKSKKSRKKYFDFTFYSSFSSGIFK